MLTDNGCTSVCLVETRSSLVLSGCWLVLDHRDGLQASLSFLSARACCRVAHTTSWAWPTRRSGRQRRLMTRRGTKSTSSGTPP